MKNVQIRSFCGPYFQVFSPNAGKYGPKTLPIWTIFTQCKLKKYLPEMDTNQVFKLKFCKGKGEVQIRTSHYWT